MDNNVNQTIEPRCICLESKQKNPLSHCARFAVFPLFSGHANFLGTFIRKALLAETQGLSVTRVRFIDTVKFSTLEGEEGRVESVHKIFHEYSTLEGIQESVHDILWNLKDVVLKGDIQELPTGFLTFRGPGIITAKHMTLPPSIEVVDKTQHIACVEETVRINMEFLIERGKRYETHSIIETPNSTFFIDSKFTPINNVNFSIYSLGEKIYSLGKNPVSAELLILDICTNGALTPEEAISNARDSLILLLQPLSRITYNNK